MRVDIGVSGDVYFFLYTVSLLFSSELYGSLKLFEGSVSGPSLSELLDG